MTNLVLKNAADADVIFTQLNAATGDNSLSRWADKTAGAIAGAFPVATALARQAGDGGRTSQGKLHVPYSYVDTATGLTKIGSAAEFNFTGKMPADFPEADKDDFVAYAASLVATSLMKQFIRDGYPVS